MNQTAIKYTAFSLIISVLFYSLAYLFNAVLIDIAPYYIQFWQILRFSLSDLTHYFPNYYRLIFAVSISIKYVLPLLLLFLFLIYRRVITKKINQYQFEPHANWWQLPTAVFILNLVGALFFYFIFFNKNFIHQVVLTKLFLLCQLVFIGAFVVLNYRFLAKQFKAFLFKPILPFNLVFTRIIFFSYLAHLYLGLYKGKAILVENLEKVALPGIGWLIDLIPVDSDLYTWFCYAGAISCFFIVIGFKTRFFLLLNALIVFYVVATPNFFGKIWHEQLVIWIAWIMAFSSSHDVLSMDSFFNKKPIEKKAIYGFHLRIIWLHFGMIYFFAGFFKLWICGFDWALSDSMVNQVHLEWFEHYNKVPAIRIDKWPALLKFGGIAVIVFELFYVAFLFSKKTRWISALGGLAMHNIIGYFMYISFSHLLQAFYIVFIPWNAIIRKLNLLKKPIHVSDKIYSLKKTYLIIPLFILTMNIICGIFRVNSYPFSIYPIYADIVPESFKYFEYKVLDKGFEKMDIHQLGKENNFRWESYSRFEPQIISKFERDSVLDTSAIVQQWNRWKNSIDTLDNIDSIEVYAVELNLAPELQKDTICKYKLVKILSE